jgi:hypothetical protein
MRLSAFTRALNGVKSFRRRDSRRVQSGRWNPTQLALFSSGGAELAGSWLCGLAGGPGWFVGEPTGGVQPRVASESCGLL